MRDLGLNDDDDDDDDEEYCWEDWEAEMRRDYPIAWFLRREAPRPFRRVWRDLEEAVYWVKCHTLRSHRFHILDLRDPGGGERWKYGWRDRTSVMLLACFKILVDFVELEGPMDMDAYVASMSEEEIKAEGLTEQLANYREMMSLYHWWKTGRQAEEESVSRMFDESRNLEGEAKRAAKEAWLTAHRAHDEQDQVYLLRLIAIREYLWT